jgi:hypothetical protein
LLEFSDPCFIRVSSVAQGRVVLIRVTHAVVVLSRHFFMLLGRAEVRTSGAEPSAAAGEKSAENAQNEANGHPTQSIEGQGDGMHTRDSGGEKRSHFRDRCHVAAELYPKERRSTICRKMTTGLLPHAAAGPASGGALGVSS